MKNVFIFTLLLSLAGCGGSEEHKSQDANPNAPLDTSVSENNKKNHAQDLGQTFSVVQNSGMILNKEKLTEKCKKLLLSDVLNKKTVSFNDPASNYYISQNSGDVYLYLEFCAENERGTAQEFKGKCIFSMDGQTKFNIFESS